MMTGWSRPIDVDRLADGGEVREFNLPLRDLSRLVGSLASKEGSAHCLLSFKRERRFPVADIEVQAELILICQRCMQPMQFLVNERSRVWLVSEPGAADRLEAGIEPVLVPQGQVVLSDLVEEELLLAVPLVPRHQIESECSCAEPEPHEDAVKQTPFAGLGELLKRI